MYQLYSYLSQVSSTIIVSIFYISTTSIPTTTKMHVEILAAIVALATSAGASTAEVYPEENCEGILRSSTLLNVQICSPSISSQVSKSPKALAFGHMPVRTAPTQQHGLHAKAVASMSASHNSAGVVWSK